MLMAAFEEFSTLQFILVNARWAEAPTQEQALKEYLRDRMWEAVRRLSVTADYLIEVLIEIIEIQEDALRRAGCSDLANSNKKRGRKISRTGEGCGRATSQKHRALDARGRNKARSRGVEVIFS